MDLKTACLRLLRQGLTLARDGDVTSGRVYAKIATDLLRGKEVPEILDTYFVPESHEKVAAKLDLVVRIASESARPKIAAEGEGNSWWSSINEYLKDENVRNALIGGVGGAALGGLGAMFAGGENAGRNALLAALLGGGAGALGGYNWNGLMGPGKANAGGNQQAGQPAQTMDEWYDRAGRGEDMSYTGAGYHLWKKKVLDPLDYLVNGRQEAPSIHAPEETYSGVARRLASGELDESSLAKLPESDQLKIKSMAVQMHADSASSLPTAVSPTPYPVTPVPSGGGGSKHRQTVPTPSGTGWVPKSNPPVRQPPATLPLIPEGGSVFPAADVYTPRRYDFPKQKPAQQPPQVPQAPKPAQQPPRPPAINIKPHGQGASALGPSYKPGSGNTQAGRAPLPTPQPVKPHTPQWEYRRDSAGRVIRDTDGQPYKFPPSWSQG